MSAALSVGGDDKEDSMRRITQANPPYAGLSDLLPVNPQSSAIASIQMFSGVMYITIVVSHLVGLAARKKHNS